MSARELDGLVAVVTGGASGIGAAIASELRDRGASVAVLDREPSTAPEGTLAVEADVALDDSVRAAIETVVGTLGRIDIVVNNAGISAKGTVEDNSDAEWQRVHDVNVLGVVRTSRAALPHLRQSPSPAIVNVSSIAATAGLPERALYSATKGAVHALTLAMAADHVREGIRVNSVNPGTVETAFVTGLLEQAADPVAERAAMTARQPHGRLVSPEEVAHAVAYLASPLATSTTGASLAVDGGMAGLRTRPSS
ncbi:short-chain dehydrogenase [Aeromicrobium sp. Root344]|uniref:SDR family NAD(P)-dependent oxidoreductase n=1 Tax=Aeromicrobium sp. Root344 TaxID=1736521 RepID=UPI0006FC2A46|nr:SDR family oxidoreductase [Aeromicrobium sp. Root344]KQV74224.1 short-chain dehydrogenase [Aeromicrobium sp. Root344]